MWGEPLCYRGEPLSLSGEEGEVRSDAQVDLEEGAHRMGGMWVDVDPTTDPEGIVFCFDDAVAPLPAGVARMVRQQVLGSRSSDTLRKGDAQRTDEVMPFEVT